MTTELRIAADLTLPPDAVTETFGVLAKRGSGKTYTAAVLAEEMLGAGFQVVIIDPLDAWWGLRSSADGKHEGLPIVVLGGEHGDLPLGSGSGSVLADAVVEHGLSCVLSLRHLSKTQQRQFVTEFLERLYHRKGEDRYRQPLHLIIDEADAFVPQRIIRGQERMVGAVDDIVRRGRSSGLGVTLITQRAAVISKDVLTQIETLIVLRTISPQDRKAMESWIDAHDAHDQRQAFMESLASLPIGTAWFWSPGWLDLFAKVKIRRRVTFDSSATPKVGQQAPVPARMAAVDLEVLQQRIEDTIERAKQDDPRELRRRIADLERQIRERPTDTRVETVVERVEVPVLANGQLEGLQAVVRELTAIGGQVSTLGMDLGEIVERTVTSAAAARAPAPLSHTVPVPRHGPPNRGSVAVPVLSAEGVKLRAGERRMLEALARHHPMKVTRAQLGTLSRFTPSGGTFSAYFSTLKRHGLIEETNGEVQVTVAGLAELGTDAPPAPQTTEELQEMWRHALRAGERTMLDHLIAIYPDAISRDELGERTGYTTSGGTFSTYLGTLKRNGLIQVDGALVRASDTLFLAGRD